jgi:[acyl-carrier-protein] S-malonyltransferase
MTTVVFSGQGSQFVGMGADFYAQHPASAQLFNRANDVLGISISDICFNGPMDILNQTEHTQVAIFVTSACIFEMLRPMLNISMFAGHSLGEITAYYAAGVLDFESALAIVIKRGELMATAAAANPGKMAAIIGLTQHDVESTIEPIANVGIANYNSPVQFVISGTPSGISDAIELLLKAGAKRAIELPVSGAFHSSLMNSSVAPFQDFLSGISFNMAQHPIVLNRLAQPETDAQKLKQNLALQIEAPVQWINSINFCAQTSHSFIEVGPGKVLSGLIKKIKRDYSVQSTSSLAAIHEQFGVLS